VYWTAHRIVWEAFCNQWGELKPVRYSLAYVVEAFVNVAKLVACATKEREPHELKHEF
jgi:hypothetical protein